MSNVEPVFQNGVFKPLVPISLPENQRVQLESYTIGNKSWTEWLKEIEPIQQSIIERQGFLPDSTPDFAEDRMR